MLNKYIEALRREATITVRALPEDIPIEGNCSAISEKVDAENEDTVRRLAEYSVWGWCCIFVTASWRGLSGQDILGCCSYKSEEDFKRDDYYTDMVDVALSDLAVVVVNVEDGLATLGHHATTVARTEL